LSPITIGLVAVSFVTLAASARAQTRWTVDAKSSLAWWQMSPHMNHLWATTCPAEPSWRPGEHGSASMFSTRWLRSPGTPDTVNVPLYPRYAARDVCIEAVTGAVTAADPVRWRGVRGEITLKAEHLGTGEPQRDKYTREAILEVKQYPEIRFVIDSLASVTRTADTASGLAWGVLHLRGASRPMTAAVRMWPESGGLRVLGKLRVPATAITEDFGVSTFALGLGVGVRIWKDLFMGVDLLMRQEERTP
jgi:polyisoprenoid-binding protein YceI